MTPIHTSSSDGTGGCCTPSFLSLVAATNIFHCPHPDIVLPSFETEHRSRLLSSIFQEALEAWNRIAEMSGTESALVRQSVASILGCASHIARDLPEV